MILHVLYQWTVNLIYSISVILLKPPLCPYPLRTVSTLNEVADVFSIAYRLIVCLSRSLFFPLAPCVSSLHCSTQQQVNASWIPVDSGKDQHIYSRPRRLIRSWQPANRMGGLCVQSQGFCSVVQPLDSLRSWVA